MNYGTLDDAVAAWDAGRPVWSIEMGGLSPGYEKAIQTGVFELVKAIRTHPHETDEDRKALWSRMEDRLREVMKAVAPALDGLSGAQAGAIMNLTYHFVVNGYDHTMHEVEKERRIEVRRELPVAA